MSPGQGRAQRPPVITAAPVPGGGVALNWTGDFSQFVVQYAPSLVSDANMTWASVVATTAFAATIPPVPGDSEAYYRVVSLGEGNPAANLGYAALQFFQLSFISDVGTTTNSNWGVAYLTYNPVAPLRYFNLSVNGNWVVQNIPLFPGSPLVPRFTLEFEFAWGITPGTPVSGLAYGYSLTPGLVATMPPSNRTAAVGPLTYAIFTDVQGEQFDPSVVTPNPYTGGAEPLIFACRTDVPNQHCGTNECGPAAVSNNLQWLNSHYNLGISNNQLTIAYWTNTQAIGFVPGQGVPLLGAWAAQKEAWVNNKNNNLPIDAHHWSGSEVAKAVNEFNGKPATKGGPKTAEQAVEVTIGNHVAAVICMGGPDSNGNYSIVAASEAAQGNQTPMPVSETITIAPDGTVVSGANTWVPKGTPRPLKVDNFEVQCPHPGKWSK
jgi:hypothetical protein